TIRSWPSWAGVRSTSVSFAVRLPAPPAGKILLVFLSVVAASLVATGAWSVVISTSCNSGVVVGSAEVRSARYCRYCAVAMVAGNAPGAATSTKSLQLASGVGVLPVRTLIATVVPAGVKLVHWIVAHETGVCAFCTRDRNVPAAA